MLERWYKMNITDVRLRKVGEEGKLKAIASVTFDDEFVVHDIKVIDGQNGFIHRYAKQENRERGV